MKSKKILKIIAIISGTLTIFQIGYRLTTPPSASSIGIIGGSDGPTAILISKSINILPEVFFVLCIIITIISGILLFKKKKEK